MKNNNILFIFFYSILFITFGLVFLSPLPSSLPHLSHWASSLQIYNTWGGSDPGSFALGGQTIYSKGWFDTSTMWLINLWPPGFMVFQGILLKTFGINAPLMIILQIFAALFLAITCYLFKLCIELFFKNKYVFFIPLILLLFPQFRIFMLDRSTVLLGEAFAINFALIGFFCLILAQAKKNTLLAFTAGLTFALSAYFRPTFEVYFTVATLNLALIFLILFVYKKITRENFFRSNSQTPLLFIFLALITFNLTTLPYKIYTYTRLHSLSWVQHDGRWGISFTPTAKLLSQPSTRFLAFGKGNVACLVDEALCTQLDTRITNGSISSAELRKNVLRTFYKHPFHWMYLKYQAAPLYWFSAVQSFWNLVYYGPTSAYIENSILLLCFILSVLWLFFNLRNPYSFITYWMGSSIFIAYAVIFLFAHFEVRYFFFFKFFFLMTAILEIAKRLAPKAVHKF